MIRRLVLCAACLAFPFAALAEPKEDAVAVFEEFLTALTAADADRVLSLFAPDALVWGTGMRDLATTPQAVRQYFSADGAADLNQFKTSLSKLPGMFPGLKSAWVGKLSKPVTYNDETRTHGLALEFETLEDKLAYSSSSHRDEWMKMFNSVRSPGSTSFDIVGE